MRIARIDLENVKSYCRESIHFTQGTNAICGPNGAGKSTLLEAIGFALFDFLPYTQRNFVREGEKTATVTVHLVGKDDRVYQVVRKCGDSNQYYVHDPEIGQRLTSSKEETLTWLYEFMKVEESSNLPVIFQDAVGVPQGLLTAAFLGSPGNRKSTFNPILRVDEYEKVWDTLREPRRRLDEQLREQDRLIAGFEAEVKTLPGLRERAASLQSEIEADEKRQETLQAELDDVTKRKRDLEAIKGRLDALEHAIAQAQANVETLNARLTEAQIAVTRAEQAQSVVEETETGYQVYLAAQAHLEALEKQREERDRLNETLQGHSTTLALAQQRAASLTTELESVVAAEAEMERLQPQVQAQERLEDKLIQAQRAADRLADAEQDLGQERARLTNLTERLADVQDGLAQLVQVEAEIAARQAELEALDEEHNELTSQVAAQGAELDQLDEQAARAAGRLASAEQSLEQEQARLTGLQTRLSNTQAALSELADVEARIERLRAELETLDAQYETLTSQAAAQGAELEQIRNQAAVLQASKTAQCPVCDGPLTPERRAELLARNQAQQVELEAALAETRSGRDATEASRRQKQKTLRELEKRAKELPRPAEVEALLAQVDAQRQVVVDSEATVETERAEVSANQARQAELETALDELRSRQSETDEARRQKQTDLRRLEKQGKELPRPAEAQELAAQIDAQEKLLAGLEGTAAELSGAPAEVERLTAELENLGDPRRDYQRAADVARQRETVEQGLTATREQIAGREGQIRALQSQLASYADLGERIEAERARQAAHESDHERYLQHIREAKMLAERRASVKNLSGEAADARVEQDQLLQERDQVAAGYDAGAYAELAASQDGLRDEDATLSERLRLQQEQVDEGQAEIERLSGVQGELDAARGERAELVEVLALLDYLRQVLRDAGPKVTKALVEFISLQAGRLYADIMSDHSARLSWTEDYEIVLTANGRERGFKQLSGGEQMAAALAVRLALLREVFSAVDVAFFDEPTANLDDDRRENLAGQILNVKGFSQLFIISHDDTFERDTDNVVRVVKENGTSRVEA